MGCKRHDYITKVINQLTENSNDRILTHDIMERLTQSPKLEMILSAQSPDEVCRATEDFRTEILAVSETETSLTAVYRTLRYTACHLLTLNGTCRKGSMAEKN